MPPSRSLPPLLLPYLYPPESSLCLVTSVLGADGRWLLERFITAGFLGDETQDHTGRDTSKNDDTSAVVLVSFTRTWTSWRDSMRRNCGIDITKLAQDNRFAFVDGLTRSYLLSEASSIRSLVDDSISSTSSRTSPLPGSAVKSGNKDGKILFKQAVPTGQTAGHFILNSSSNDSLTSALQAALSHVRASYGSDQSSSTSNLTLVLDDPAVLLATGCLNLQQLLAFTTAWAEGVCTTVVSVAVDTPLMSAATSALLQAEEEGLDHTQGTAFSGLEEQHAAFVASLAHRASSIMQLRRLETGTAKDVSGVLAVAPGPAREWVSEREAEEKEILYLVRGDGKVDVFERGSS